MPIFGSAIKKRLDEGFSLLEVLVSSVVLILIMFAVISLLNMISMSYQRTSGRLEAFDSARAAFDAVTRTVGQAVLLSYLGYDDPSVPSRYELKSDLHFLSGPQHSLGFVQTGAEASHAVFFQAPLGIADDPELQSSNLLLNATGFFLAYGDDPVRPDILEGKVENRNRYRLFQFFQPREEMSVYRHTIAEEENIPVSNDEFAGADWFLDEVESKRFCRPLAANVIALVILPVVEGEPADEYLWNSRDPSTPYSLHRLPQALRIAMAVIDEKSAAGLGNSTTPPELVPETLFARADRFHDDLAELDAALAGFHPPLNYRIFTAEIPLDASNTNL